jgi:hypothetical protein
MARARRFAQGFGMTAAVLIGAASASAGSAGHPFVGGRYADPDMKVYNGVYWVYPTYSAPYDQQTFLDAFSSTDLVHWSKSRVLDKANVSWATRAIWAPSPISRNGLYYLYFGANDIQTNSELGGIGVATSTSPGGPFIDALGRPLIAQYYNGAQPIDQNVFLDDDGQAYLYYGGHGHCNVVRLNSNMTSVGTFPDGTTYKEITPSGYVEGALMFKRNGGYYLMWSEGYWGGPDYRVSYARSTSPTGPFNKVGTILSQNASVGTGAGHNTVFKVPGTTDDWYIMYHRHPLGATDANDRYLCFDRMYFNADGTIQPVVMKTEDNFNDGNSLGWTTYGGTWTATGTQYTVAADPGAKSVLNTNFASLVYDADLSVGATGNAGLLFRITGAATGADAYNGYYAGLDAGSDRIVLGRANGGWTPLASVAQVIDPNVLYHLKVVANGANIKVYFNNAATAAVDLNDSTFASGAVGLRTFQTAATFDNVAVAPPAPGLSATFYTDVNFTGTAVSLGKGNYTRAQLEAAGFLNDAMSSLKVPAGWTVDVYENNNYAGLLWKFTADSSYVGAAANDKMSSVKIY